MSRIAILLPPREHFSPNSAHAVGLLARIMARPAGGASATVYGSAVLNPFTDVPFKPVSLPWRPYGVSRRYAIGAAKAISREKPDLIEVHDRPDLALHLARAFPKIPVVLFLHNDPQAMPDARTPRERAFLLARLALVAPVSAYLRDRLLEGVETRATVEVFANFVDLAAMPKPAPQKCILFAGRLSADKGADSFVAACDRALKLLPGWRAEMIGADDPEAGAADDAFVQTLRADAETAHVAILGWRPHGEVLHAMAKASIVVVPSRWQEPFGLIALEAMACGAPLLCAPRGGLAEVMGDAALPINPGDPATIAANIVALALDAPRRMALSKAGLARAAEFSADAALVRLAGLRQRVLAEWPRH
jgi:UDP-glucose:(glucosyl)LPS alpha-1,2-glucosyltransferase